MPWPPAPCPPAPEPGIKAEFSFTKVSQEGQPLSGAKFVMIDQNGRSCEATSGLDGKVTFQGLKFPMFYGLHEAQAPAGYQRPCDDMRNSVWIDRYGQIYFNGLNYGPDGPRVVNMPCVC
ncbi:MAG: prealbumin-like fold domain-containing protein [Oscillospiraceae bacterium]|jgi:uncharacterized surface anchored protein|nr:prealbumin-like fold domain-containing protein [Oscillospiraceae bacterium]